MQLLYIPYKKKIFFRVENQVWVFKYLSSRSWLLSDYLLFSLRQWILEWRLVQAARVFCIRKMRPLEFLIPVEILDSWSYSQEVTSCPLRILEGCWPCPDIPVCKLCSWNVVIVGYIAIGGVLVKWEYHSPDEGQIAGEWIFSLRKPA